MARREGRVEGANVFLLVAFHEVSFRSRRSLSERTAEWKMAERLEQRAGHLAATAHLGYGLRARLFGIAYRVLGGGRT